MVKNHLKTCITNYSAANIKNERELIFQGQVNISKLYPDTHTHCIKHIGLNLINTPFYTSTVFN